MLLTDKKMLTNENYFSREADEYFMSVSQYKSFEECPAAAIAAIKGEYVREETTSLLVGSYVDAHFEGTLDLFKAKHPAIFKKDGSLKSEYVQAEEIIERIERDKMFMEYMSGKKQVIMTGTISGVPIKIKIDAYHPGKMIVDGKIMKDFAPIYKPEQGRLPWFEAWRYDLQGAVYQEIVRQNTGEKLPFYLTAATKEKVTDLEIIEIEQDLLDFELEKFAENVPLYDAMKKGVVEPEKCGHCDYCKMTKVLTKPKKSSEFAEE